MNLALAAGNFLAGPTIGGETRLRAGAAALLAELLESLDPERLGKQVKAGLAGQLARLEVSPLLGRMLEGAIADKRHLPLLEELLRWAGLTLEANEDLVREMIHQRANALLRLNLAKLYAQGGDKAMARKELQTLAQLGDKFPMQKEVKRLQESL